MVHKTYQSNKTKKVVRLWLLIILAYVKIKAETVPEENHRINQQPKKQGCKVQKWFTPKDFNNLSKIMWFFMSCQMKT